MNIYKGRLLPDKSTVANDATKPIRKVSREWFITLDNLNIRREKPLFMEQRRFEKFGNHENNIMVRARGQPMEFDDYVKDSCRLFPDGLDINNGAVYDFYGCRFHGCQRCYKQGQHLYHTTME